MYLDIYTVHTVIHSGSSVALTHHLVQVFDDPAHQEGRVSRHRRRGRGHLAAPAGTLALILTLPTTHFTHTYILHNILIKSFEKSMNVCVYVYVLQTYIAYIHTYIHVPIKSLLYDPL